MRVWRGWCAEHRAEIMINMVVCFSVGIWMNDHDNDAWTFRRSTLSSFVLLFLMRRNRVLCVLSLYFFLLLTHLSHLHSAVSPFHVKATVVPLGRCSSLHTGRDHRSRLKFTSYRFHRWPSLSSLLTSLVETLPCKYWWSPMNTLSLPPRVLSSLGGSSLALVARKWNFNLCLSFFPFFLFLFSVTSSIPFSVFIVSYGVSSMKVSFIAT